jgi:hypothetical protein
MEQVLAQERLADEMASLEPRDQVLHIDLAGRDPDCGATLVPYVKGALFLKSLERAFGSPRFDEFLKDYFAHFQFHSLSTEQAILFLRERLFEQNGEPSARVPVEEWVSEPGMPASAPRVMSELLLKIETQVQDWKNNPTAAKLRTRHWSNQEWLYFLRSLPRNLSPAVMKELDDEFHLTQTTNSEILHKWLLIAVQSNYEPAYPRIEEFLTTVGRRIYVKPIYEELMKSEVGRKYAKDIYSKARTVYHPIVQATIDNIVGVPESRGLPAVPDRSLSTH